LRADPFLLDAVLARFPADVRVAVEPRHDSWFVPAVRDVLSARAAALCWADRGGRPLTPLWRTAEFGYLRLHEGRATPRPRYGRRALRSWVSRIASTYGADEDVFVYFNNDPGGAAVVDATAFAASARRAGRPTTRASTSPEPTGPTGPPTPEPTGPPSTGRSRSAPDREGRATSAQAAA
jgi:uncharacterized protein YecE (DUF72 family)